MSVSAKLYGTTMLNQWGSAPVNWTSDTLKTALATSSYTPDQDAHDFFNDITNEVSGTGYSAGGVTLTTPTKTYTGATNVVKFDADDVSWTSSTITARYAVVYKSTGTSSTSPVILYVDFGADVSTTNGTFAITWDSAGLWTVTVA